MVKGLLFPLLFALFLFHSGAHSIKSQPQELKSFNIQETQDVKRACSYTVSIKTSCSSVSYTRDKISLAFGDAYHNEVYAARLDDPSSGTFERCSTDTFQIQGPCAGRICYLYLRRVGSDGWIPENVKIYGPDSRSVTFYYGTRLPNGVWYGFDLCSGRTTISGSSPVDSKMDGLPVSYM
ncbi:hypothetical protein QJS10_CPA07g00687 [Acorus calamus]|uniref:Uncharacterized protein n=1 Tax=Acorus calamus TaxID=4465 RepID=A0AAV9EHC7_ACOCL|nr:hypothetical protein QJS10_CPA07g00667 [Acorus calamus]KAK1312541.1 hypothetical protein QJS10_CPA07g00687 [Acorus calamus]